MKKYLDKLLSRTLLTYGILLSAIFLLKIFGLDYFGIDSSNKVILLLNDFVAKIHFENVWYSIILYINTFIILSIMCNDNSKKLKIFTLCTMPFNIFMSFMKNKYSANPFFIIYDLLYVFILGICYIKFVKKEKIHKNNIGNYWLFMIVNTIYQMISMFVKNLSIIIPTDFVISNVLYLDYLLLCIMTYKLYFIKGGNSLWQEVLGCSSDLLISLRKLPTRLLKSYQNAKPKENKEHELASKIYLVLFWLYNFFTVVVILLIATLNDTFIECIFIISSFWINKAVFGKAFHLKKASTCFVVSTLSYYILNRLTCKIGLSLLVPVVLGIALSYITSKIMERNTFTHLYRGMPKEDFYHTILAVTDNKQHIGICKRFYVDKQTDLKISYEYNYSVPNIKKIKQNINKKIRELQK